MEITLEMVDQVRERTGATYEAAKAAIEAANGNVVDAIIAIERENSENSCDIVEKMKSAVQQGNVTRIRVLRGEEELINIPVSAGIAGGVLGGLLAGPWLLISAAVAGAVARFGFDCRFQLVNADGTIEELTRNQPEEQPETEEAPAEAVEEENTAAEEEKEEENL